MREVEEGGRVRVRDGTQYVMRDEPHPCAGLEGRVVRLSDGVAEVQVEGYGLALLRVRDLEVAIVEETRHG